ncbi:MAG: exopolysaccharide biosynthesis protein [Hyphomonas sp.]|nr:exopolysaccharide biosynthesis protein [Hyphomonas sp.]
MTSAAHRNEPDTPPGLPPGARTSDVLAALAQGAAGEHVTFGELFHALQNRAFAFLIILFTLPNLIPMIPGVSIITGLAIILLAAQLALGFSEPWLPKIVSDKGFARADLQKLTDRAVPFIRRFEAFAAPRLAMLSGVMGQRMIGLAIVLLGCVLILPIPIVGNIPPAWAIVILSLGLIERDGVVIALGYAVGVVAAVIVGSLAWGIIFGVQQIV